MPARIAELDGLVTQLRTQLEAALAQNAALAARVQELEAASAGTRRTCCQSVQGLGEPVET